MHISISQQIAQELSLKEIHILAVLKLFSEGNTVPFIARYRKEQTGNLDEVVIRTIQERAEYLKELQDRKTAIIDSIQSQGKLTPEFHQQLLNCNTKQELEDLYLPYKPKRRTRAMIARERGLESLAQYILDQPMQCDIENIVLPYVDLEKEVSSAQDAWAGARDIVAEIIAEQPGIRSYLRSYLFNTGIIRSQVISGKEEQGAKFQQYFDFREPLAKIPSHRYLALRRGESEEVLQLHIDISEVEVLDFLKKEAKYRISSPLGTQLEAALKDSMRRLLLPALETDVRVQVKMQADQEAVKVFSENLHSLLMAPPLGHENVVGIDPGLRTGCKCAALNQAGKFLNHCVFYLHQNPTTSKSILLQFLEQHRPHAIAIGNGTASRETEAFVREVVKSCSFSVLVVVVSEAGASVYSASDIARQEFPELDITVRGAISIARRLQDPLAELVKVDPKSIGVGQYQHDVHQPLLHQKLSDVVESCVNTVGVNLNTASASLLSYVAGIGPSLAEKIVRYRENHGLFQERNDLLQIAGFGPRTFQQAAGFLRVHGKHPLDASAVHPERYTLVETIAKDLEVNTSQLIGNATLIAKINIKKYIQSEIGEPTLRDILNELQKPGRDPRASFEAPTFRQDVQTLADIQPGMVLEGVVTNVAAFGAFVDVGVHQDGLLHISEMADHFVKDPFSELVVGQKVVVKVLEVEAQRKRISFSRRLNASLTKTSPPPPVSSPNKPKPKQKPRLACSPFDCL